MLKGDISNNPAPRLLVVFEGTLGFLDPTSLKRRNLLLGLHRWKRAAACWDIPNRSVDIMVDFQYRQFWNIDIVTYLGAEEAGEIQERLDGLLVPYGHFLVSTHEAVARRISLRPDVAAVIDGGRPAASYGAKGRSGWDL